MEASDVCILLLIPEQVYMSEMFARHSAKHQTKDKISFLKETLLFKHWTMDQLGELLIHQHQWNNASRTDPKLFN
jgi:hypothetical protein